MALRGETGGVGDRGRSIALGTRHHGALENTSGVSIDGIDTLGVRHHGTLENETVTVDDGVCNSDRVTLARAPWLVDVASSSSNGGLGLIFAFFL